MKKVSVLFLMAITILGTLAANAQDVETVSLVQTPGEFKQTELKLKAGKKYIFEVENQGVDKPLGFVVAPKGKQTKSITYRMRICIR